MRISPISTPSPVVRSKIGSTVFTSIGVLPYILVGSCSVSRVNASSILSVKYAFRLDPLQTRSRFLHKIHVANRSLDQNKFEEINGVVPHRLSERVVLDMVERLTSFSQTTAVAGELS